MQRSISVNLDLLFDEFVNWQQSVNRTTSSLSKMKDDVMRLQKELAESDTSKNLLKEDIIELRNLVESLQTSLHKKCDYQDENEELKTTIKNLNQEKWTILADHESAIVTLEQKCEEVKISLEKKSFNDVKKEKEKAQEEIKRLEIELKKKHEDIGRLQKEVLSVEKEKHAQLMKLRLETDNKVLKLQKHLAKSQQTYHASGAHSDIFRKKVQHLKQESEQEIMHLKTKISDLERKLQIQNIGTSSRPQSTGPFSLKRKRP